MSTNNLPRIDKRIKYVGVSHLRSLKSASLRALEELLVIQDHQNKPIAVIAPFGLFVEMQEHLAAKERGNEPD